MQSMTGFGRGTLLRNGREMTLELKSVNHRYLDLSFRMPRCLGFLEEELRTALSNFLSRGHVDIYVSYKNARDDAREIVFDGALAAAYWQAFDQMHEATGLDNNMTIADYAKIPDIFSVREKEEDQQAVIELALEALGMAAEQLVEGRLREGAKLAQDVQQRAMNIEASLEQMEALAKDVPAQMKERITQRIADLLGEAAPDPARIAQEAAILADKAAIDEETVRLRSHLSELSHLLQNTDPVGRKLDFLVQEMNREVNTIGSKTNHMEITGHVLAMKADVEKIREQVQNIE